ncbi:unnamed protein product [Arabidopsis halleri]
MMRFQLVLVIFLMSIDRVFPPMTKKRSKLRNHNSTSDQENDSPRGSRSSSYREIPCRDSSSIIINRFSSGFDGYIFGSLSRPPENCSVLFPRCNFTGLVQFLKSLSKYIASRYISIDDVVSIWRFLECRCVLREIQISLRSLQQFTRFRFFVESSLWCGVVHALNTVSESGFRRQNPLRQGENFKSVVVICGLDLYGNDCYSFLQLESLVYENNVKTLMSFGGLRMIAPPYDGSSTDFHVTKNVVMVRHLSLFVKQEACCFEVLMNFAVERFLQFHSYVSAHMRLMEQRSPSIDVMEVMLLSCLTKVNSFSSKWLDLHVIIGSQSCVSRHEKIWSRLATLIHEAVCIFARKGLCFTQELFGWLKCFLFVVIGCSITEIHSDVVYALCATPELLMTLSLL